MQLFLLIKSFCFYMFIETEGKHKYCIPRLRYNTCYIFVVNAYIFHAFLWPDHRLLCYFHIVWLALTIQPDHQVIQYVMNTAKVFICLDESSTTWQTHLDQYCICWNLHHFEWQQNTHDHRLVLWWSLWWLFW